jgi:hypothetical protein
LSRERVGDALTHSGKNVRANERMAGPSRGFPYEKVNRIA